jgi:ubiquinol-cytochrome c reductase cytochrome b subunit
VYLHMFRGLMYGSYRKPRELTWIFGCLIYLCLMAEAFFGYLLPWGQMSYWGAQVIVNLFATVPFIGEGLSQWIRGDYTISDITLNRFFAFHVAAVPLVLVGLVAAHLMALHETGSNNPDGIEIKQQPKDPKTGLPLDGIYSHPYYTYKDIVGVVVFLAVFSVIVFFVPDMGGYFLEANNYVPANPLQTPEHIAPVWYFTPFYAILRAVPSKLLPLLPATQFYGVVAMGAAVMVFFALPWLDRGKVKSIRYRGTLYKSWLAAFVVSFLILGYLGVVPVTVWGQFKEGLPLIGGADKATVVSRVLTVVYFLFFLLMPWYTARDKTKPVPERVTW